jgi:hypothetical protein
VAAGYPPVWRDANARTMPRVLGRLHHIVRGWVAPLTNAAASNGAECIGVHPRQQAIPRA